MTLYGASKLFIFILINPTIVSVSGMKHNTTQYFCNSFRIILNSYSTEAQKRNRLVLYNKIFLMHFAEVYHAIIYVIRAYVLHLITHSSQPMKVQNELSSLYTRMTIVCEKHVL